ncbi:MAG: hypothetical protein ACLPKB_32945 [Xanthobacteraceae bacterium]
MKKAFLVLAAAGSLAAATVAVPDTANAQRWVPGLIGGLAAGAIIGGAIASSPPPGYYYGPGPYYYGAPPAPGCYWGRGEPYWDGYRWVRARVQVCP